MPLQTAPVRRFTAQDAPLVRAVDRGDEKAADRAIAAGASPNAYGTDHETLLMRAVYSGATDMIRLLVRRGANPNARAMWGYTAIDAARSAPAKLQVPTVRTLLSLGARPGEDSLWAFVDSVPLMRMLLMAKAPVSATALNRAIEGDRLDTLRLMLGANAPVNGTGTGGHPLHVAAASGRLAAARLLLAHGARRDLRDEGGSTAGEVARRNGNDELAALLGATVVRLPRLASHDLLGLFKPYAAGFTNVHDYAWRPDGGVVLWRPVVTRREIDETQSVFNAFDAAGRRTAAWKSAVGLDDSSRLAPNGSRMAWKDGEAILDSRLDATDERSRSASKYLCVFWTADAKNWVALGWNTGPGAYDRAFWRDGLSEPLAANTGVRPLGDEIDPTWVRDRDHVRTVTFIRDAHGEQDRARGKILATSLTPKATPAAMGRFVAPREGRIEEAAFSPDGERIAWIVTLSRDHRVGVWTTRADGSAARLLGTMPDAAPPSYGVIRDVWIRWRLDGQPHHLRWTPTGGLGFVLRDTLRVSPSLGEAR